MTDVFLDLWGVLTDSRKMTPAYRERVADVLRSRHGGSREAWLRAHDVASAWYEDHMGRPETWVGRSWIDAVDDAEARSLLRMFHEVGVEPPRLLREVSRALEYEVMSSVDAAFPDARPALARLKRSGHRVFVSTNATESNARGALVGARLLAGLDGVFTGELLNAGKRTPAYWRGVLEQLGTNPARAFVLDDRLDYLSAAAQAGFRCLLMDRDGRHASAIPTFVEATLRTLAGLSHYLATASLAQA